MTVEAEIRGMCRQHLDRGLPDASLAGDKPLRWRPVMAAPGRGPQAFPLLIATSCLGLRGVWGGLGPSPWAGSL